MGFNSGFKGLKEEIGLLYKWGREMPTFCATFLNNCHTSSTLSLQQSPETRSVAVTLEAALSSETSEQSFYHTHYEIQSTIISDILI